MNGLIDRFFVTANRQGYARDSVVVVQRGATDAASGVNLSAAYTAAKSLLPGGAALSTSNRAVVILPPGGYSVASALTLDGEFVDVVAMFPERGGDRLATDWDKTDDDTGEAFYRGPATCVYGSLNGVSQAAPSAPLIQTANDVHLVGFACRNNSTTAGSCGFLLNASDNTPSLYDTMYFWQRRPAMPDPWGGCNRGSMYGLSDIKGTWKNCIGNNFGLREADGKVLGGTHENCQWGSFSIGGDSTGTITGRFKNVRCVGIYKIPGGQELSGFGSFGGCSYSGNAITSACRIEDCEAGPNSYAAGKEFAGTIVRSKGGGNCCGATILSQYAGSFVGTAIDCDFGATSCGAGESTRGTAGTINNCRFATNTVPFYLYGATIRRTRIECTTTATDAVRLKDSNSKLEDNVLVANNLVIDGNIITYVLAADGSARTFIGTGNKIIGNAGTGTGIDPNVTQDPLYKYEAI